MLDKLKSNRRELEEYDPEKHGDLVEGVDAEVGAEIYPINPPFAYARVRAGTPGKGGKSSGAANPGYEVIEPPLTPEERATMEYIKDLLVQTLEADLEEVGTLAGRRERLREAADGIILDHDIDLGPKSREKVEYYMIRDFLGFGRIDPIMNDENVEDISCDGPSRPVFVYHREHGSLATDVRYEDEDEVQRAVSRLAQKSGRHISLADPLLDATLPDGSRIQLSMGGEVTTGGSTYTIRKFREVPYTPPELVDLGTFSPAMLAYVWLAIDSGKSVIFAGGTASGKTTSLNAASLFVRPESKVVSIEDTRELNIPHENWIPGLTRGGFGGEAGERMEIDMYDLLKAGLRQRPEYLIVGEVRGEEAYVLFQAMATGHITLSTLHAESARAVFRRLRNPPMEVPLSLLESLEIVCVQASLLRGGKRIRRCLQVSEVVDIDFEGGDVMTEDVFTYDPPTDGFKFEGSPRVLDEIKEERTLGEGELEEELKRREEVIEKAREEGRRSLKDFWELVVEYGEELKQ